MVYHNDLIRNEMSPSPGIGQFCLWTVTLVVGFSFTALASSVTNQHLPNHLIRRGYGDALIILIMLMEAIPQIVFSACIGHLVTVFGPKIFFRLGALINAIACVSIGFTVFINNFLIELAVCIFLRFFQGFGMTLILTASLYIAMEYLPSRKYLLITVLLYFSTESYMLGTISSIALNEHLHLKNPIIILGGLNMVTFMMSLFTLRKLDFPNPDEPYQGNVEETKSVFENLKIMLKIPQIYITVTPSLFSMMFCTFFNIVILLFMDHLLNYEFLTLFSMTSAASSLLFLLTILLGVAIDKDVNCIKMIIFGALMNSALFLVIGILKLSPKMDYFDFLTLAVAQGIFSSIAYAPLLNALIQITCWRHENMCNKYMNTAASNIFLTSIIIGQVIGAILGQVLFQIIELRIMFLVMFSVFQLLMVIHFCMARIQGYRSSRSSPEAIRLLSAASWISHGDGNF